MARVLQIERMCSRKHISPPELKFANQGTSSAKHRMGHRAHLLEQLPRSAGLSGALSGRTVVHTPPLASPLGRVVGNDCVRLCGGAGVCVCASVLPCVRALTSCWPPTHSGMTVCVGVGVGVVAAVVGVVVTVVVAVAADPVRVPLGERLASLSTALVRHGRISRPLTPNTTGTPSICRAVSSRGFRDDSTRAREHAAVQADDQPPPTKPAGGVRVM